MTGSVVGQPAIDGRNARLIVVLAAVLLAAVLTALLVTGPGRRGPAVPIPALVSVVLPTPSRAPGRTPIPMATGESWILYERLVQLGGGLFAMRPDGTDSHAVVEAIPGVLKHAAWSPDGKRIAVVDDTTEQVWVVGIDGSDPQQIDLLQ